MIVDDCPDASSAIAKSVSDDFPSTRSSILGPFDSGCSMIPARSSADTSGLATVAALTTTTARFMKSVTESARALSRLLYLIAMFFAFSAARVGRSREKGGSTHNRSEKKRDAGKGTAKAHAHAEGKNPTKLPAGGLWASWRQQLWRTGRDLPGEHEARVQEEVVRHHHRPEEGHGDVQRIAAGGGGGRKAGDGFREYTGC